MGAREAPRPRSRRRADSAGSHPRPTSLLVSPRGTIERRASKSTRGSSEWRRASQRDSPVHLTRTRGVGLDLHPREAFHRSISANNTIRPVGDPDQVRMSCGHSLRLGNSKAPFRQPIRSIGWNWVSEHLPQRGSLAIGMARACAARPPRAPARRPRGHRKSTNRRSPGGAPRSSGRGLGEGPGRDGRRGRLLLGAAHRE